MVELKIDQEFRDKIPPLTEAEFEQLRENILSDGEVYEPIAVWNGTIVDGHNRWKIIQEHPEIPFRTKQMNFSDKWAAFEWMYKKQLGRRNLTDEQKTYMIGKMYEARKKSVGAPEGNANAKNKVDKMSELSSGDGQNVHSQNRREQRDGTAGEIGKEIGVDGRTVRRAEQFAKGVDTLKKESPEAAEKILQGNSGMTKAAVRELPSMEKENVRKLADSIKEGPEPAKKAFEDFKRAATMEECNATPIVHDEPYNEDDFAGQVEEFPAEFDDTIRFFLTVHEDMLDYPNCNKAFEAMLDNVEEVIEKYRRIANEHKSRKKGGSD